MQGLLAHRKSLIAANIASQFTNNIAVVNNDDDLQKGVVDEFRYGEGKNIVQIKKTGKELKAGLEREKQRQEKLGKQYLKEANKYKEEIGVDPTENYENWRYEKYPEMFKTPPKSYEVWKYRRENEGFQNTDVMCSLMHKHNDCISRHVDATVQIAMLNTLINNVDEKKTYPLNIEMATMLGL